MRGQVEVATTAGRVMAVRLRPARPAGLPARRSRRSDDADWVVLGPGSWFTSVIPHLLVRELRQALVASPRPARCVTLNLEPQPGETDGFSAETHLEVLAAHAPDLRLDVVLADPGLVDDQRLLRDVAAGARAPSWSSPTWPSATDQPGHDPLRLAAAYRDILG